jgi:hypothetical protein
VILRVGDRTVVGHALDPDLDLSPTRVATAVRSGAVEGSPPIRVLARRPPPVHERVGCVHPDMGLRVRTALAAAGRALGLRVPADAEVERLDARIEEREREVGNLDDRRAAVAEASTSTDRLRETVAETRGRLQARRENDLAREQTATELETAVSELAAVETEAIAARQALTQARLTARERRTELERRLELEDALANARRRARRQLVDRLRDRYAAAVRAAPGCAEPADPFDVDAVTAALAVARIARFEAPVVCAAGRFPDAAAAAAWLDAPVVRL